MIKQIIHTTNKINFTLYNTDSKNTPILFIHGVYTNSSMWEEHIQDINEHPLLVIDVPGNGYSQYIEDNIDLIDSIHSALFEILPNLDKIIIVGYSFGTFVSLLFAEKYNSIIQKIILINPVGIVSTLNSFGYYWAFLFKYGILNLKYLWDNCRTSRYPIYNYIAKYISFTTKEAFWNHTTESILKTLNIPIVFVYSYNDEIIPLHQGIYYISILENSKLFITLGNNHSLQYNKKVETELAKHSNYNVFDTQLVSLKYISSVVHVSPQLILLKTLNLRYILENS